MTDHITLTGLVATEPKAIVTTEGLAITTFRLASNQRRFDRAQSKWVDGDTNWYTITTFRQLALNSGSALNKGERVVVSGKLRLRQWDNGEKTGMTVDVEAESIGHDLAWGTSVFTRSISSSSAAAVPPAESEPQPEPEDLETSSTLVPEHEPALPF